jgi:hypothetical protein
MAVFFTRVLGRLHERDALAYFLKADSEESSGLDVGRRAVLDARKYSREHDTRVTQQPNASWFWADHRAEALGLHTVNGVDVSEVDQERDIKDLRKKCRLIDGVASGQEMMPRSDREGRRGFTAPMNALSRAQSERSSDGQRSTISKKRAHQITDLTDPDDDMDDEMEQEIRQQTRIIEQHGPTTKKARVKVVIGRATPT